MATKTKAGMTFSSPSIAPSGLIDSCHTCDGDDLSPELRWSGLPEGTRSMALIVDDPDAPSGTFTHWVLFDIPASVDRLAEGAAEFGVAGRNDFRRIGYGGPCPPREHGPHRYFFRLYALDVDTLELPEGASRLDVERAMAPHILEQAELMGRYVRR